MAQNQFGTLFAFTTWGESHGKAIGVVIDGCPAGLALDDEHINNALARRAPGTNPFTTPRKEKDTAQILSGVFEGITTGAPISIMIENGDADSTKYQPIKDLLRPGHANATYLHKYGIFDYRGGGRASARETASRVAAGAVAEKLLDSLGIRVIAHLESVGTITAAIPDDMKTLHRNVQASPIFVADPMAEKAMGDAILAAKAAKDSLGGIVSFIAEHVPPGLGEPLYSKIEAMLASAMMSIPASKGFEIGSGFMSATMKGSEHNDIFINKNGKIKTITNYAGGTLGGITTGMQVTGRVAFKPTSSISQPIPTLDVHGATQTFTLPEGSRHDACVAVRAVPVVEAMLRLVLADAVLLHRARAMETPHTQRLCTP